ncbi:OmpA family protein [Gilvimarinus agarilyticus]|uniref:OmpA family protein n=1 Tax=Gilvimarinus sp. 2_MG-2023 TaxID=3062666 RepID=UPI001C097137|nr:OmpA family protein [Gilvimarinus sp. 2_MG-2023]MBU2885692.1 OmpA family protein [Gilvimarinus agarilyticus]MDO6570552.1 OmpA family protein [Gilvimarinus sp. 2_MG-2023]
MLNKKTFVMSAIAAAMLVGCATSPMEDKRLSSLEGQYTQVSTVDQAREYAPVQLKEADEALEKLERLIDADADESVIQQQVYLVERKLAIATQTSRMQQADQLVEQADDRRHELLLAARTQRAEQAELRAAEKEQQARMAEDRANQASQQAQQAREQAEQAQSRALQAEQSAQEAQARAEQMSAKASKLEAELENISTEKTERGLVLTLGNILFELDEATLKSGSERTLQRVASFLQEYPEREVLIEGFTDSTGNDQYNLDLSDRRASAVEENLVGHGVDAARISTQGYGEAHPVASNDTSAGRLQNRRVEIVIGNQGEPVKTRQ